MDARDRALREAFRRLALPIATDRETAAIAAAEAALDALSVEPTDRPAWLGLQVAIWRRDGSASPELRRVVRAALRGGDETELGEGLARAYFDLHKTVADAPLYDFAHATALLSHARLAAVLARDEGLSASTVASVLKARDARTPISWKVVDVVLSALGFGRSLTPATIGDLTGHDDEAEVELFGDADFRECADILGTAARSIHFGYDLEAQILALFPLSAEKPWLPEWNASGAHLTMLYYCCAQAEFWDHKVTSIYEFAPRGRAAQEVAKRFRDSGVYTASENPFLNNAKSAPRVDRDWAWTKGPAEGASAHALANVLDGLDALAFSPKRYLAGMLRAWLNRIVRVRGTVSRKTQLPTALSEAQAWSLLSAIAAGPTATRGVLEQRLTDVIGVALHGQSAHLRGLGDAVNANNVSRGKMGDVEFEEDAVNIVAYEPHGGSLRQVYVDAHALSLGQVLPRRVAEWEAEPATRGTRYATVMLVCFDVGDVTLPEPMVEALGSTSLEVTWDVATYHDLLGGLDSRALSDVVSQYLLAPLDEPYVPERVKQAVVDRI